MNTSVIGFPRIGAQRELKFATERYFRSEISSNDLLQIAKELREKHWKLQKSAGITHIPSGDFSFYDTLLDTAALFNLIPKRYQNLGLSPLETIFAMARGYQGEKGDVRALAMKKWFNTNYHYIVPEYEDGADIRLVGQKPIDEFLEAKALGIQTKVVLPGPYTLLKLTRFIGQKCAQDVAPAFVGAYLELIHALENAGGSWIQLDEPALVLDMGKEDLSLYQSIYSTILKEKGTIKVLLQTYFGDIRDAYSCSTALPFDGIGLDFLEGRKTLDSLKEKGFPDSAILFAGVLNGKNIWRNHYAQTLDLLSQIQKSASQVVLSTSCSLLHSPYTVESEEKLPSEYKRHLSFAVEKLTELSELGQLASAANIETEPAFHQNRALFEEGRSGKNPEVLKKVAALQESDFTRLPQFSQRKKTQSSALNLPILPTTTIGSFPQTADVRKNRTALRKGEIDEQAYKTYNKEKIAQCIAWQEEIGLDVLVHGEFERNDMVEYFGENLDGYLFTTKGWVQSYGTRCVKPPIVWGDISRKGPITVEYSSYAQSLTNKPVKGMLTGPVTILNWSFPREDLSLRESTLQIALAIREEVLDLEKAGIPIIQIDEAALREKLPLRKSDWHSEYLDWAIPAFRLVHSGVKPETQIHTHMCYSEFTDIIPAIDAMDADVISFEASRSDLRILDALNEAHFQTDVGPGVYDIHSPRVPSVDEIKATIEAILQKIPAEKLWINPDCGLKTRGESEVKASLIHMVEATKQIKGARFS